MDSPPTMLKKQLIEEGVISEEFATRIYNEVNTHFEGEYKASLDRSPQLK